MIILTTFMSNMANLNNYKKNIYSQNGEDGIIIEILRRSKLLNKKSKWACEFGAWDGIKGSNTFNLIKNYKFNGVYIEGDKKKFNLLIKTSEKFKRIIPLNMFVSHKKKSNFSLERILNKTKIPKKFEVLSIDIDSYDLSVWESFKRYDPQVVIIEINSGIKPGILQKNSYKKRGNSFTSTVKVGLKKGYFLVSHTGNCIFVKKNLMNKLKIEKKFISNPNLLFDNQWLTKKDNIIKFLFKKIIPFYIINLIRNIKHTINLKFI